MDSFLAILLPYPALMCSAYYLSYPALRSFDRHIVSFYPAIKDATYLGPIYPVPPERPPLRHL